MPTMPDPAQLELLPTPDLAEPRCAVRTPPSEVASVMAQWQATEIFDEYWRFAALRQAILMRRLAGLPPPWTSDPILQRHRFTNPYRLTDRVSQHLLRNVQYDQPRSPAETVFRTLLFKVFNRIDTWTVLVSELGEPAIDTFDAYRYGEVLDRLKAVGQRIYSPAYIVPNPPYGSHAKHHNHLRMLAAALNNGTITKLAASKDLTHLYQELRAIPSLGPFLAFQYAIDINYSEVTSSGEEDFVIAGPGARDGLRKCFAALPASLTDEAILWVAQTQEAHFSRLGLRFETIGGRALQPIDCQNLFCEIEKYTRVSHPWVPGSAGRRRIKQSFNTTNRENLSPIFIPPKWQTDPSDGPPSSHN